MFFTGKALTVETKGTFWFFRDSFSCPLEEAILELEKDIFLKNICFNIFLKRIFDTNICLA